MNKSAMWIGVVAAAILIAAGVWYYEKGTKAPALVAYSDAAYGISFMYPKTYKVQSYEVHDTPQVTHYDMVLIRNADLPVPVNGEGPPSITISIYPLNSTTRSLEEWLMTSPYSNYHYPNSTAASTTVMTREAITYRWSGLYEGVTTAFTQDNRIIAVSGTYLSERDEIVSVYKTVLNSISLP